MESWALCRSKLGVGDNFKSVSASMERVRDPYELDRLANELAQRESSDEPERPLPLLAPLSHDHPHLSSSNPTFDAETFLLSRPHTSLQDLRTELREYLATLKEELVQLINDDYAAFISLSTDLRDEGTRLERLKAPLGGVREEFEVCRVPPYCICHSFAP